MFTTDNIMKKLIKWGACTLLVAVAAMTLAYRLVNQLPSADLPADLQVLDPEGSTVYSRRIFRKEGFFIIFH